MSPLVPVRYEVMLGFLLVGRKLKINDSEEREKVSIGKMEAVFRIFLPVSNIRNSSLSVFLFPM